ncbi:MAG: TRAP transporter small permease [bacterium]|nr:TRAP transporter small permease [bacterium]
MVAFIERLSSLAGIVAAMLIGIAIIIVCQMVFIRYVLVGSTAWQTEVVTFSLVAATMLGSAYVLKQRGHVSVGLAMVYASSYVRRIMQMVGDFLVFLFAALMFWKGLEVTLQAFHGDWTTESIYEFPMWIPYASMPIGFGLLALQAIACMIRASRHEGIPHKREH